MLAKKTAQLLATVLALVHLAAAASPLAATEVPAPARAVSPAAPAVAFDSSAATRAYLDRLTPEQKEHSDAYFEGGYWLKLWGFLYGLVVAWLLLSRGFSRRMREVAERLASGWLVSVLYGAQYLLATTLLYLPLGLYAGYFREHQYGLSNQTLGAFFIDEAKGLGVSLVLGSLAIGLLYAVLRAAPRTWWVWGTVVTVVFLMFASAILPIFILPLFNDYTRLEDPAVREPILSLARANGVPAHDVWVSDASRQTKRISANVSGFAGTERITLNDNLLARCTLPEIRAVMAHEIGHYALNHMVKGMLFSAALFAAGFAFLAWSFERARQRWGESWGIRGVDDPAGLPLFAALLSVFFFFAMPVTTTISRTMEAEADLFGLNAAQEPDGFAEVALKLAEYRKLEPSAIEELLFFDHPSGKSRIEMAMRWKAEQLGTALPDPEP
ncbi:MAG TPA: M48 family metalloprotease [Thermoanaerobaculia bacterium]|nr:M48 family metalloprotease [Thermoanaerobaculia bacterium]